MLAERSRYEARILAERLRGAELESEARVRAARILREAEEGAARLHSEAGAGFRDAAQKLRELLELRDALLAGGLEADLHGRAADRVA